MGTPPTAPTETVTRCALPCPQTASQRAISNLPVAYLRLLAAAGFTRSVAHLT